MQHRYFLQMIQDLRRQEEIVLYEQVVQKDAQEQAEVLLFLESEYEREAQNYPFTPPAFHALAAAWSSDIVYHAAQLILYRKHADTELELLFPPAGFPADPSAMLTADLCLRFLPDMLYQLKAIDSQDQLVTILEGILCQWHYSGIKYDLPVETLDFEFIEDNSCLMQLYTDRIIEYNQLKLSAHPACFSRVKSSLGIHAGLLWKEFKLENEHE